MVVEQYYINTRPIQAQSDTGLAVDELESIVGRFRRGHKFQGHLRGQVYIYVDGGIEIRHHFNKKILWKSTQV